MSLFHLPGSHRTACGGERHKPRGWRSWSAERHTRPGWLSGFCYLLASIRAKQDRKMTLFSNCCACWCGIWTTDTATVHLYWDINPHLGDFFIIVVCQSGVHCKIYCLQMIYRTFCWPWSDPDFSKGKKTLYLCHLSPHLRSAFCHCCAAISGCSSHQSYSPWAERTPPPALSHPLSEGDMTHLWTSMCINQSTDFYFSVNISRADKPTSRLLDCESLNRKVKGDCWGHIFSCFHVWIISVVLWNSTAV